MKQLIFLILILLNYAFAYEFKLNEKDEAIKNGKKLISIYKNDINYQLLGSIYLEEKEYLKSYELFDLAYKYNNLSIVDKGSLKVNNRDISFLTKENEHGTALFYNKPFNYIPYLNEINDDKILFYLIFV